jgi:hypothetical protein
METTSKGPYAVGLHDHLGVGVVRQAGRKMDHARRRQRLQRRAIHRLAGREGDLPEVTVTNSSFE